MPGHRLSVYVAGSLLVHATIIGWLATREPPVGHSRQEAGRAIELEILPAPRATEPDMAPEPVPVPEVMPEREPEPARVPARASVPAPDARVPVPAADLPASHIPATASDPATALAMRGQRDPQTDAQRRIVLDPAIAARAIERDPHVPPPLSPLDLPAPYRPPRSELVPDGNGTYRGDDLVFRAKVERDGRVHIEDKPNLQVDIIPSSSDIASGLEAWRKDPYGASMGRSMGETVKIAGGSFDATDAAMRAAGQDPYYFRKAQFLERTRAQREAMSERERRESARDAVAQLPAHLDAIWAYTAWTLAERRRVLFELWDECAEGDEDTGAAGAMARRTIIAFVRRRLPRDSEHAYTADELGAFNQRRRSSERFAPYE